MTTASSMHSNKLKNSLDSSPEAEVNLKPPVNPYYSPLIDFRQEILNPSLQEVLAVYGEFLRENKLELVSSEALEESRRLSEQAIRFIRAKTEAKLKILLEKS